MTKNPLLGTGFETFWLGDRLQKMWSGHMGIRLNEAHNGYLEVYLNLGFCGVALLAVMIVAGYRTIIGGLRLDGHLSGLKLAYFVAALNYSHSEAGFRMASNMWIYFLLATAAVPRMSVRSTPRPELAQGLPDDVCAQVRVG
jgi:O-antigen ligase